MSDTHGTSYLDEDTDFDMLLEDDLDDQTTSVGRPRRGIPKIGRPRPRDAYKPARLRANPNWSRIAAAGFVAVVFLFIVIFGATSFMGHRKQAAYASYFTSAGEYAVQSDAEGQQFDALMSKNGGVDRTQLVERLQKLADQSGTLVANARKLTPPDSLKPSHEWLVSALDYRHNGLLAERKALTSALVAKDKTAAAATIAEAGRVLQASDQMYLLSFVGSAREVLKRENISGITVKDSKFVKDDEIGSPKAQALVLDRLQLAAPAAKIGKDGKPVALNDGKVHGGSLTGVIVSPSGQTLSTGGVTKIMSSAQLAFEVTFTNQGEVQETNVPVTITISGDNVSAVNLTGSIDSIDPGQTGSVRIPLPEAPSFGQQLTVKVTAGPVPGEKNVENNTASYLAMFSLDN
ncbi:MAG: hypothetical protein H7123_02450 [Thermoleophilia bacterium]|nr:hypothetical protein [Thermoleophilia bacterium]